MSKANLVRTGQIAFLTILLGCCAHADSIELRDGRLLHGKYLGGNASVVGFMTDRAVEYIPVSTILVLIFENSSASYQPSSLNPKASRSNPAFKVPRSAASHRARLVTK